MTGRDPADRRLERILYLLPAAAREGGAELDELADRLGVTRDRLMRDLEEVLGRAFYHPTGGADDVQIAIERGRVEVRAGEKFRRPPKLSPREALALHLGLRMVAAERAAEAGEAPHEAADAAGTSARDRTLALARRLERELAVRPVEAFLPGYRLDDGAEGDEIRALLFEAARERRAVRLSYLKPGSPEPEERTLEPYVLAHAGGRWYALGRSRARDAVRAFRLDRIVGIDALEERFPVPEAFDPADYLEDGRVYRAEEETEVEVRYSARIARWLAERGWGEPGEDGDLVCVHRAADPSWPVRHALGYGPDAEVLSPPGIRWLVRETAERVAAGHA